MSEADRASGRRRFLGWLVKFRKRKGQSKVGMEWKDVSVGSGCSWDMLTDVQYIHELVGDTN